MVIAMATKSTSFKLTLKITSFIVRLLMNIVFYIFIVILTINISKRAFEFAYQLYGPDPVHAKGYGRPITIQIKKGEATGDIASKLELNRAIENKYSFWLKVQLEDLVIMPGTYEISSDMTYDEILDIITDYSASIIKVDEAPEPDASDTSESKDDKTP